MARGDTTIVVLLLVLGLLTRFTCLNYPREVVWDEYHFGACMSPGALPSCTRVAELHAPIPLLFTRIARVGDLRRQIHEWVPERRILL